MSNLELNRVALTSGLLLFICFMQLVDVSPTITRLASENVRVAYPYYDKATKKPSLEPEDLYKRRINWWVSDLADLVTPVLLAWALLIKADFERLGFSLWPMWITYFCAIAVDRLLFLGKVPFGFTIEVFMMCVQSGYLGYCYFLSRNE